MIKINNSVEYCANLSILNPVSLLNSFGTYTLLGILVIVLIESGFLFPFLPGDALLFTIGLVAAGKSTEVKPFAPLSLILITIAFTTFIGGQISYYIGKRFGCSLFKPENKVLKYEYITNAQQFFQKYGFITIIIARFVPIVRTYASVAAGIAHMKFLIFTLFNFIGAWAWTLILILAGYYFGNIEIIRNHIELIFIVIVLISLVPILFGSYRAFKNTNKS